MVHQLVRGVLLTLNWVILVIASGGLPTVPAGASNTNVASLEEPLPSLVLPEPVIKLVDDITSVRYRTPLSRTPARRLITEDFLSALSKVAKGDQVSQFRRGMMEQGLPTGLNSTELQLFDDLLQHPAFTLIDRFDDQASKPSAYERYFAIEAYYDWRQKRSSDNPTLLECRSMLQSMPTGELIREYTREMARRLFPDGVPN